MALIDNRLPKAAVADVCGLFNNNLIIKDRYPKEELPQYLIGITKLLGIGYNLTKAYILVIFDPEWMQREQDQVIYRIYRIGQQREYFIYYFQTECSVLKKSIWDR